MSKFQNQLRKSLVFHLRKYSNGGSGDEIRRRNKAQEEVYFLQQARKDIEKLKKKLKEAEKDLGKKTKDNKNDKNKK